MFNHCLMWVSAWLFAGYANVHQSGYLPAAGQHGGEAAAAGGIMSGLGGEVWHGDGEKPRGYSGTNGGWITFRCYTDVWQGSLVSEARMCSIRQENATQVSPTAFWWLCVISVVPQTNVVMSSERPKPGQEEPLPRTTDSLENLLSKWGLSLCCSVHVFRKTKSPTCKSFIKRLNHSLKGFYNSNKRKGFKQGIRPSSKTLL